MVLSIYICVILHVHVIHKRGTEVYTRLYFNFFQKFVLNLQEKSCDSEGKKEVIVNVKG